MPQMNLDPHKLKLEWSAKYPNCEPRADTLREIYKDRWVRLHTLPLSKRHPENELEYKTVLERHNTLIEGLNPGNSLLVITTDWTNTPEPESVRCWPKRLEVEPDATQWDATPEDPDENDPELKQYRQVYISKKPWEPGILDKLLRAVADDELAGVIIAPEDFEWLYAPYDGGVDIILPSQQERDALKERHTEWLSTHPEGL